MSYEISRFIKAHQSDYQQALSEIKKREKMETASVPSFLTCVRGRHGCRFTFYFTL